MKHLTNYQRFKLGLLLFMMILLISIDLQTAEICRALKSPYAYNSKLEEIQEDLGNIIDDTDQDVIELHHKVDSIQRILKLRSSNGRLP